tara:strand:- start:20 stop:418 length:399 start_codon:yes stop_codon:yes gene_type:complete
MNEVKGKTDVRLKNMEQTWYIAEHMLMAARQKKWWWEEQFTLKPKNGILPKHFRKDYPAEQREFSEIVLNCIMEDMLSKSSDKEMRAIFKEYDLIVELSVAMETKEGIVKVCFQKTSARQNCFIKNYDKPLN